MRRNSTESPQISPLVTSRLLLLPLHDFSNGCVARTAQVMEIQLNVDARPSPIYLPVLASRSDLHRPIVLLQDQRPQALDGGGKAMVVLCFQWAPFADVNH